MADTASPPEFQTISVTCDGRRATLTLNRPDRLNALSNELMAEVADAATWFDHQPDLRVVVVRGEGRAFSAGFDLTVFGDAGPLVLGSQGLELLPAPGDGVYGG